MNYLAHFHLAWPDRGLVIGGLEGDFYKGPFRGDLDPAVERGIKLHRAIDAYTDSHPIIEELRTQFPKELRRYAGILIDISFDHYLTLHWSRYSDITLESFNQSVYQILEMHTAPCSDGAQKMIRRLVDYNVLARYHEWGAVIGTAIKVGERFRRGNPFGEIESTMEPTRELLERAFLTFYPDLLNFSKSKAR